MLVIPQKTELFLTTGVRTSNPILFTVCKIKKEKWILKGSDDGV
jgi:hypothetical protein